MEKFVEPNPEVMMAVNQETLEELLQYFQAEGGLLVTDDGPMNMSKVGSRLLPMMADLVADVSALRHSEEEIDSKKFDEMIEIAATNLGYAQALASGLVWTSAEVSGILAKKGTNLFAS